MLSLSRFPSSVFAAVAPSRRRLGCSRLFVNSSCVTLCLYARVSEYELDCIVLLRSVRLPPSSPA